MAVTGLAAAAGDVVALEEDSGWTLPELVAVALDRNPGLEAARTETTIAREDIAVARGQRLPRLDAVGSGEFFPRRERLLIFRHGFRKEDNPFENAIVNYGLEVTLPLYTSGRVARGITLARARAEAARSRERLTQNELIFNVASAYYTGLRVQQVIAALEAALTSLEEALRVAELQRQVGRIAPLDKLRLETRMSQAERDLAGARSAYAQTIEVLKELINVPPEVMLDISGELFRASNGVVPASLREQALAQRPDLVALRHEVRAQREAIGVVESRLGPSLDLKANYRGVTGIDDGTTKDDAAVFLQFRMPLYEGGVLRAQRRKAVAQLRVAELRLQASERRALAELELAALELNAAQPRIEAARRAVGQAEESLRIEREKFALGRGTSNDLLLAEEALLRSRTELAAALADSQIARASLNLAIGERPVAVEAALGEPVTERR
jgi:outer membrane protein TolC